MRACQHRWAEITCKYPETNNKYQYIEVLLSNGTSVRTSKKDEWEDNGRLVLYHDTKNKNLRVAIKRVKERDFGEYRCVFKRLNSFDIQEGKLETGKKCDICSNNNNNNEILINFHSLRVLIDLKSLPMELNFKYFISLICLQRM